MCKCDLVRRLPEDWRRGAEELDEHAEIVSAETMAYRMLGRAAQMRKSAEELDRAIAEQGGQRVPEGWKLVPVEPTAEMRLAARAMRISDEDESWAVYPAMLAAAPQPELGESDE